MYDYLKPPQKEADIFSKSGVYQLTLTCYSLKYLGHTGKTFKTRFREHVHVGKTNGQNSKYAQHILDTGHTFIKTE
jgi:hypothetical protein